jgi:hypothetical protein
MCQRRLIAIYNDDIRPHCRRVAKMAGSVGTASYQSGYRWSYLDDSID